MSKFEYNNLNKFFVSVGVFLIGLTFILPWLFFRENFDLLVKESDLHTYTKTAQNIIIERQIFTSYFPLSVLIGSTLSLVLGTILSVIGIRGWIRLERNNKQMENLKTENQQLVNKKLSQEIEKGLPSESKEAPTSPSGEKVEFKNEKTSPHEETKDSDLKIPINNTWELNHWGSDVASVENDKMIFKGTRTRLETDGCHINLKGILKIGNFYKVSCYVKSTPNTTAKFQLWCHDDLATGPHCSEKAIPYATPSSNGERCSLSFEAKCNTNLRIHLQYFPGEGQIEVSDIRIAELPLQ